MNISKNNLDNFHKFLAYSIFLHIILITVFSIKYYQKTQHSNQSIDIILVTDNTTNTTKNNKPDFLAQANTKGGGNIDKKYIPKLSHNISPSVNSKNLPDKSQNKLPDKLLEPQKNPENLENISDDIINSKIKYISSKLSDNKYKQQKLNNNNQQHQELINNLITQIQQRSELYAKRPKKRFITASTLEYRDAKYISKWRKKIEYYGNKYYPSKISSRNLSGEVLLSVALKSDGSINNITISKSSGINILDEAAIQTVYMAEPFDKFTTEMKKDTDILEITRTWRFNTDNIAITN